MELKKNPKANLEKSKALFFQLGMIIALAVALMAFEWSSQDKHRSRIIANVGKDIDVELTPVTESKPEPLKAPPAPVPESFDIVDNTTKISLDFPIIDNTGARGAFDILPQWEEPESDVEDTFDFLPIEDMPKYRGGDMQEFRKYVAEKVVYPSLPQELGVEGRVYISFMIDAKGNLVNAKVARSSGNAELDNEALRAVNTSEKWTPGKQRDHFVKVNCIIPVVFQLTR